MAWFNEVMSNLFQRRRHRLFARHQPVTPRVRRRWGIHAVIFSFRLSLKRQIANSGRKMTLRPATVLVSLIALYWLPFSCASHFRFGSISFVPVDGYSRRVTRIQRKPLDWKVSISFIYNPLKSSDIRHVLAWGYWHWYIDGKAWFSQRKRQSLVALGIGRPGLSSTTLCW